MPDALPPTLTPSNCSLLSCEYPVLPATVRAYYLNSAAEIASPLCLVFVGWTKHHGGRTASVGSIPLLRVVGRDGTLVVLAITGEARLTNSWLSFTRILGGLTFAIIFTFGSKDTAAFGVFP